MSRMPAITSLLKGHETNVRFGSISVTCNPSFRRFNARAQAAPPKPPPITATRGADCANEGDGNAEASPTAAMPRTASLRVADMGTDPVSGRRRLLPPSSMPSGEADVLVPQGNRTDALAGCCKIGVEHRGRGNADGRLAHAAPEPAARHHHTFHLRHLVDAQRVVGVEVGLLDLAILHRTAAVEQRGQPVDEGAGDLPFDLRGIDDIAGIGGGDDAMHLDLVAVGHRDFGSTRDIAAIAHHLRNAAMAALPRW